MRKEYIAKSAAERNLSLNSYSDEDGAKVWCWEDSDTHEASQEFASEEEALQAMRDERLVWNYVNDDGYVIQSPIGIEIEPDEDDGELDVTEVGELLAELHWDSGGPGAGAGVVSMYGYKGRFYVSHDAGIDEYETAHEALERNGFLGNSGATTSVWIHPELQIAPPLRAGSQDTDSALKDWPRLADFEQSERGYNEYQDAWGARKRRSTQLNQIPMAAIEEHRQAFALAREQGWRELGDGEDPDAAEVADVPTEPRILQVIECSSMVSTWNEYLCFDNRDGRAVLSHRRYEMLAEVSEFAVETDDGDEEYRIPEVIDGKEVVGTEDEFVMGGELALDPADPEPEMDLAHADREEVSTWLTERGFDLSTDIEAVWPGAALQGLMPRVHGGDEVEGSEGEVTPADEHATAQMAAVTHLRIRLLRWMDSPATPENDYPAEIIKEGDKFHYRARGVTVPITANEAVMVIRNPFLYYFSTAFKLDRQIDGLTAEKT